MSFGEKALEYMRRKQAGMYALVENHARRAEGEMKQSAAWKDRTATARRSLHTGVEQSGDKIIMYMAHGVRYGGILEEGSPPHVIRAKNKKALYWRGAKHPVKQVNHPGTKPYPTVKPVAQRYKIKIKDTLVKWWAET